MKITNRSELERAIMRRKKLRERMVDHQVQINFIQEEYYPLEKEIYEFLGSEMYGRIRSPNDPLLSEL